MVARSQLVKLKIQGMLVYTFMIYAWPKKLSHSLQMSLINFICTGDLQKRAPITVKWKHMCKPTLEGRVGIRNLLEFNEACLSKLAWNFMSGRKTWSAFGKARYYCRGYPTSSIWKGLKIGLQQIYNDVIWMVGRKLKRSFWFNRWLNGESVHSLMQIPQSLLYS